MDDVPVSQNNRLIVDFVSSELRLDSLPLVSSSDRQESDDGEAFYNAQSSMCNEQGTNLAQPMEEVFLFDLSVEMLQKLYVGIHAISPQCEEAMAIVEQAMERQSQNLPSSSSLSPPCWIIRSNGIASFRRITGDSDTWVRVFANSPKLTQGDPGTNTPFSFHCLCASVESSADFSIEIPELRTENATLAKDRIAVTMGSIDTLNVLHKLWKQVMKIIGNETSSSRDIPIDVSLAGADISVKCWS
jgi:hypothetical protein